MTDMKKFIIGITISLLASFSQGDDNQVKIEIIDKKHEYTYEQDSKASFSKTYPGNIKGIINQSIVLQDFKPSEDQVGKYTDEICYITNDRLELRNSTFVTTQELIQSNYDGKIITLVDDNVNLRQSIYVLTSKKDVLEVSTIVKPLTLGGITSFSDIVTEQIDAQTNIHLISNLVSQKLYVVGNNFIVSKQLNILLYYRKIKRDLTQTTSNFSTIPFEEEKGYQKNCHQVKHLLSLHDHLILSCLDDGLVTYKVGTDGFLKFQKAFKEQGSVYHTSYGLHYNTLAFLHDAGISFIKFDTIKGFDTEINKFKIEYQNGRFFSQDGFKTFWIKNQNDLSVQEFFVSYNNQTYINNGEKISNKPIKETKLLDIYGMIANENNLNIYIHSIPQSQVSDLKDKIVASVPLHDTLDYIAVQIFYQGMFSYQIFSVTEKTLNYYNLTYYRPTFSCNSRDDSGTFLYKVHIYSQDCDVKQNSEHQVCDVIDQITVKVKKPIITSSDQSLAIGLGVGLSLFFVILIVVIVLLCIYYKKKKTSLVEMEETVRNLKQLKYMEFQEEKLKNSTSNKEEELQQFQ